MFIYCFPEMFHLERSDKIFSSTSTVLDATTS